jgi:hypothetical protein
MTVEKRLAAVVAIVLCAAMGSNPAQAQAPLTPREAIGVLKAGNDRFAHNASSPVSLSLNRRRDLALFCVHGSAQEKKPAPPVRETPKETVGVLPTASPTQVAAAIADALRSAEAAQARRQAATVRPVAPRPTAPATAQPHKRYEVRWPSAASDRITLEWPQ